MRIFSRTRQKFENARTALKMHDLNTLTTSKHKNLVKRQKKVVSIRWLSLHISVDGVYDEYAGLLETWTF